MTEVEEVEYRMLEEFPGYRFGSDGSIWSRLRKGPWAGYSTTWKRMKFLSRAGNIRPFVTLRDAAGKCHYKTVCGLICRAFHGDRPEGKECCHDPDRDPWNNAVSNLRWDTRKANRADSIRHGTMILGAAHRWTKIADSQIVAMKGMYAAGMSQYEVASRFGVNQSYVSRVINNVRRRHISKDVFP